MKRFREVWEQSRKREYRITRGTLLTLLAIAWLLAGCSQENELTFYRDEQWRFESTFTYNPDDVPEIELSVPIISGLSFDASTGLVNPTMLESVFDEMVNQYQRMGLEASWQKRESFGGDVSYTLLAEGIGWDSLVDLLGGIGANEFGLPTPEVEITQQSDGTVHLTAEYPDDLYGLNAMLMPTTLRVKGGRILQHNANEVQGGTAIWRNPSGTLNVTLTPAMPPIQIFLLAGVGAVVLVGAGGGGFLLWQMLGHPRPSRPPHLTRRTPPPRPKRPTRPRPFSFLLFS